MRLEAHVASGKLALHVHADTYEEADAARKEVDASRYSRKLSDRYNGKFVFLYPLTPDKCVEMRQAYGDRLKVHRTLGDWYREARQVRAEQVARTQQTDATLPRVAKLYPRLNAWLKGDQRVTASWVANAYRGGGLLADEVGTGKTAGVVAGLVEANIMGPTLIVCPKISVRAVWFKHLREHTDIPVYACHGTRAKREKTIAEFLADPAQFKVLVVVAEMLRIKAIREHHRITEFLGYEYPPLFELAWSACVIDESHKVLGAMDVVKANLAGEGIKALRYDPAGRLKLAVTATPFGKGGRTEALFGTLHWLWPDEFSSRWAWLRKYFDVYEEAVYIRGGGGATKPVQRVGEVMNEAALWADLGPRVLRRTMEEVSPDHRGLKHFIEVGCEMEGPQLAQYRRFAKDAELPVEGGILSAYGTLDYMIRCRQIANGLLRKEGGRVVYTGYSAKIERLMAHLEQLDPERKVVVASQWNEYLDAVEARLEKDGYACFRLDGKTSERNREMMMNAWQDPKANIAQRVFLLNTQAGGVSITLDAADEMHALDEMFPPETMEQLFGRIFRRGRVHDVFFYLYRSLGTIDEEVGYKIADGAEKQRRLLDGRRGLEYAREIAKYKEEL